ncbi:MAG: pyruvate kinase [Candidatus Marinimicrobia bacterium]|nr:pyruvate kinase [Candidatus Neomarinimicrobiota bacterium]
MTNTTSGHRGRHAKVIATLGPSSQDPETIADLLEAGADVFRLNFSHGSHQDHAKAIAAIRNLEKETGQPTTILMDLQGPKLRVGKFQDGKTLLKPGASFRLDLDEEPGDNNRVQLPHPEIFKALRPGSTLLIDDGHLRLRVKNCGKGFAETEVVVAGTISDRKGVNVPDVALPIPAMTDKDKADLTFGLEQGIDWVALSFVQRPEDVVEVRKVVGERAGILSKLEKPAALDQLDTIVELSDSIMVARGDLGVEMPLEQVPVLQKRIIRTCRAKGKPVVVATQMLDSMIKSPVPTRAEASDVATAIYDGADAVMLSAETAVGSFPVRAVATMHRIICQVEGDEHYLSLMDAGRLETQHSSPAAITAAARQISQTLGAAAIITFTSSGSTTLRAAQERPDAPILCVTPNLEAGRRMGLVWGVHALVGNFIHKVDDIGDVAVKSAKKCGIGQDGQALVITAGMPFGKVGSTNMVRVVWLGDEANKV